MDADHEDRRPAIYLMIRIDPDKVTPPKTEADSDTDTWVAHKKGQ